MMNHTFKQLTACLAVMVLACTGVLAQGMSTVTTIEDETFRGVLSGLDDGSLVFALDDDKSRTVPLGEIDGVAFEAKVDFPTGAGWVLLAGGDRLPGTLEASRGKESLVFKTMSFGELVLPFKVLRGYLPAGTAGTEDQLARLVGVIGKEAGRRDVVTLEVDGRENVLLGVIESYADGTLTVSAGDRTIPLEMNVIRRIAFSTGPEVRPEGARLRLSMADGSQLTGRPTALQKGRLAMELAGGVKLEVPLASVVRIEVVGGNLVKIDELEPLRVRHYTKDWGDSPFEPQVGRNALKRPMVMAGTEYRGGLGMRAETEMTWTLAGKYRELRAVVGLDDIVRADPGKVVFIVEGDGKELFKSEVHGKGSKPEPIKVSLDGVKTLVLKLHSADGLSKGTVANWARLRLLKK